MRQTLHNEASAQGETANDTAPTPHKPSAWAVRGVLSTIGQSLQLVSGLKSAGTPSDRHAIVGFASVNLLANAINIIFGAQKKDDPHHLRFLKNQINAELAPLASPDKQPPSVDQHLTTVQNTHHASGLLQRYSVMVSEFALRTVGSLSLIAPITGWGKAVRNISNGMSLKETFLKARTSNPVTMGVGLFSLAGKAFVVAAKEPDPYNPEPPSLWRSAREKLMFRASTVSEAIGAGWMAHDRFTKQKTMIAGKLRPDFYGGFGNLFFDAGYVARWVSPYGTREVNMPELYAHVAQGLRTLPEEKVAPMLEQISGELAEHFKEKKLEASVIRQAITQQMKHAHSGAEKPTSRIQCGEVTHAPSAMAPQVRAL